MRETATELESLLRDISYWIKKKGRDALSSVRITLPQFQYSSSSISVKPSTSRT